MSVTMKNRNMDPAGPEGQERPANVDSMGRALVNPGLDGDLYKLFVPAGAVGAGKTFFDLFNATTDKKLEVVSVTPIVDGSVAVTGALAVNLFLTRTTAVGTGGTAATAEGTALTAATISKLDPASPNLPTGVTARLGPGGGATGGAVLGYNSMFSEETNAASYNRNNIVSVAPEGLGARVVVPPNSGIRVVQGAIASVGNIGFEVVFSVLRK